MAEPDSPDDDLPALPRSKGMARSLPDARPGQMLLVDGTGSVVGPSSRAMIGSAVKLVAGASALGLALSYVARGLLGGPGALVVNALFFAGVLGWLRHQAALGRALQRLGADDLVGAEASARALARSRIVGRGVRANAWHVAACAVWLRGDLHESLALTRRCLVELGDPPSRVMRPIATLARLNEVQLLAILGDLAAAKHELLELQRAGLPLDGDLVRVQHIDTQLVLAFEADDPAALPPDLDPWVQAVLRTNRFGTTLVLLAWALSRRAQLELVPMLLDIARDRLPECHLDVAHPRLARWHATASSMRALDRG